MGVLNVEMNATDGQNFLAWILFKLFIYYYYFLINNLVISYQKAQEDQVISYQKPQEDQSLEEEASKEIESDFVRTVHFAASENGLQ